MKTSGLWRRGAMVAAVMLSALSSYWSFAEVQVKPEAGIAATVADPCNGVERIDVNVDNQAEIAKIPSAFSNVQNYSCLNDSAYCLCFNIFNKKPETNAMSSLRNLSINSDAGNKPVYIDGLNLKGFRSTVELIGSQPISLTNSNLDGCTECLRVEGSKHKLKEVTVTCGEKEDGVAAITLIGEGHKIENVTVTKTDPADKDRPLDNCGIGIQIGDVQNQGNNIAIQSGELAGNMVGLWLANGNGNTFKAVSIFNNDWDGDGIFKTEEGILFDEGVNQGLKPPEVLLVNEELKYALSYPTENPDIAYLKVRTAEMLGSVEIHTLGWGCTEVDRRPKNNKQGKTFVAVKLELVSIKGNAGNYERLFRFVWNDDNEHLKNEQVTLLLQDPQKRSSQYSGDFCLNEKDIGILSAVELDAPAAGGDLNDAGSHSVGDTIPVDSPDDDDSVSESGMGVAGPAGTGSAGAPAVISGGIGGAPGSIGGIQAAGCSLSAGFGSAKNFAASYGGILILLLFLVFCRKSRKGY